LLVGASVLALSGTPSTRAGTRAESAAAISVAGSNPAWSPSGQLIAFADLGGSLNALSWRIFVVGADGTGRRQVVDVGRDAPESVSWSPNGARLAYDAFDAAGQTTSVFTVALGGGRPSEVTTGWAPSWGPGNTLLIVDRSPEFSDTRLYVANADGSGKQELEPCPDGEFGGCFDGHPDWSANGSRIAFDTIRGSGSAVWAVDANGANRRQLTPFFPAGAHPRWSPDGAQVVYAQYGAENSAGDIAVVNADGSGGRVVVKDGEFPDWSPDGRRIVFARSGALYLVNVDGSNVRAITAPTTTTLAPKCIVPKLVGKTLAAAKAALKKANCTVGKVTRARSRKVKAGRVISSKPKAGVSKPAGTAVTLVVSRGR